MNAEDAKTPVLDREFLQIRTRLLDLAAALDRLERSDAQASADPRMALIREGLRLLSDSAASPKDPSARAAKAAAMQLLFSLPYDDDWRKHLGVSQ